MTSSESENRANEFAVRYNLVLDSCLGVGTQGSVFMYRIPSHSDPSVARTVAVKFHEKQAAYDREVSIYLRLRDLEIEEIQGLMVPQLVGFDDDLLAIEMTIVSPPFCLDFGGAYLDQPPDYSPEVWADWRAMKSEAFEQDWPAVERILAEFRSHGVFIADVNPGNIRFR